MAFAVFEQARILSIGATPAQLKTGVDFLSFHCYPTEKNSAAVNEILNQLSVGKPIVIEETAPLECSISSLERLIITSKARVAGWMFFYWGKPLEECQKSTTPQDVLQAGSLQLFQKLAPQFGRGQ